MTGRRPVLVTGATGFVGPYLCAALRRRGCRVVTLARAGGADFTVDVRDRAAVAGVLRTVRPAVVFHLAAVAYAPEAEAAPELADAVNRQGTENVLDAAAAVGARTLFVSTGAVYGPRPVGAPPAEERCELRPRGAYAQSKAAAEAACLARAGRQSVTIVRPFNHTGPGQSPRYVCSDFARQIARCERGLTPPIVEVGNLSAERDFLDVRDVVEAYARLAGREESGEIYNVCSGRAVSVREILETLLARATVDIEVRVAEARLRQGEAERLVGSYAKLERATGWRPAIPLERTLADLLDFWRGRERLD